MLSTEFSFEILIQSRFIKEVQVHAVGQEGALSVVEDSQQDSNFSEHFAALPRSG